MTTFVVWTLAGITIMGELGINLGALIAGAGLAGVALGFGAQSLVKDFLAGIFILVEDQYGVGDIIDAGEATGTVEAVSLRTTRIRDVKGTDVARPQRADPPGRQQEPAVGPCPARHRRGLRHRRRRSPKRVIKEQADAVWRDRAWAGQVLEEPEVWGIEHLGPDGVTIRLVVKTQPAKQFTVLRELRARIKRGLEDAGVEIPFPQRTVWVRNDTGGDLPEGAFGSDPATTSPPAPAKKAPTKRVAKASSKRS